MNRHFLPLCAAMICTCIASGQSKNFKAVSLNVDGLPDKLSVLGIADIKMNPDGPLGPGATAMGEFISTQRPDWDLFALSEDFNFEDELKGGLGDGYTFGTHRGKMYSKLDVLTSPFDTDGLNIMVRNKSGITFSGETYVRFTDSYGKTGDGSDQLIKKGFRYYLVNFGDGLTADLYIHHMDVETDSKSNAARESNVKQVIKYILDRDESNTRPIIIMGDSNCRYTRDNLEEWVINAINNHEYNGEKPYQVRDPWIDLQKNGIYPKVGDAAHMTSNPIYGAQKGEVVDKIWYINNKNANGVKLTANSYLNDTGFKSSDPSVKFADHPPIVIDFTIEKISNPNDVFQPEIEVPTNPFGDKSFFLRNMQTGECLALGACWGTMASSDKTGTRINMVPSNNGLYNLMTPSGYLGDFKSDKKEFYMDKSLDSKDNGGVFNWEIVPTEYPLVYELYTTITYPKNGSDVTERRILSSEPWNVVNGEVKGDTYGDKTYYNHITLELPAPKENEKFTNVIPLNQKWQLISEDDYKAQLQAYANPQHEMDATSLTKGWTCWINAGSWNDTDKENGNWKFSKQESKISVDIGGTNEEKDKFWALIIRNSAATGWFGNSDNSLFTVSNTVTGLPNGKYTVSGDFGTGYSEPSAYKITASSGSNISTITLDANNKLSTDGTLGAGDIIKNLRTKNATKSVEITVSDGTITLTIDKTVKHKEATFFVVDNLTLTYFGPENVAQKTITLDFPDNRYSTLMLPFDYTIPESSPLTAFLATGFDESETQVNSAGEKIEYHYITVTPANKTIKANVPYIVKYAVAGSQAAPRRADAATEPDVEVPAEIPTHTMTFTGYPTNWKDEYRDEAGILTGTHIDTEVSAGHYQMFHNDALQSAYLEVPEGANATIEANRAYINGEHNLGAIAQWGVFDKTDILTGVEEVADDTEETITDETPVDVYTTGGILLRRGVAKAEALNDLPRGLYILTNGLTSLKVAN